MMLECHVRLLVFHQLSDQLLKNPEVTERLCPWLYGHLRCHWLQHYNLQSSVILTLLFYTSFPFSIPGRGGVAVEKNSQTEVNAPSICYLGWLSQSLEWLSHQLWHLGCGNLCYIGFSCYRLTVESHRRLPTLCWCRCTFFTTQVFSANFWSSPGCVNLA